MELTEKQKNIVDFALSYMGANIDDIGDMMAEDKERGFSSEINESIGLDIMRIRDIIDSKRLSNRKAHEERVWKSGK